LALSFGQAMSPSNGPYSHPLSLLEPHEVSNKYPYQIADSNGYHECWPTRIWLYITTMNIHWYAVFICFLLYVKHPYYPYSFYVLWLLGSRIHATLWAAGQGPAASRGQRWSWSGVMISPPTAKGTHGHHTFHASWAQNPWEIWESQGRNPFVSLERLEYHGISSFAKV